MRRVMSVLVAAVLAGCAGSGAKEPRVVGEMGAPTAEAAKREEARREEARLEAARAVVRREEVRVVSVRVLKGEARAEGVVFAASGGMEVATGSRLVLSGLIAPGSGATVITAPQVLAMVGQEASVRVGDSKQGECAIRVTVLASAAGVTRVRLGYEEGPELARTHVLAAGEVEFKDGEGAAVRVAGPGGKDARIVMVTVDAAPEAARGGK